VKGRGLEFNMIAARFHY